MSDYAPWRADLVNHDDWRMCGDGYYHPAATVIIPRATYTRVYVPYSRIAHLLADDGSATVLCQAGRNDAVERDRWRGTGSYEEERHAERLRTCRECVRLRAIEAGGGS